MILLYKPTVTGPTERLDTLEVSSREAARAFLNRARFELLLVDGECAGCHQPIARGDVARMKPYRPDPSSYALSFCRGCAAVELLPIADAVFGTAP